MQIQEEENVNKIRALKRISCIDLKVAAIQMINVLHSEQTIILQPVTNPFFS